MYTDAMSKIYLSNFKAYLGDITKLTQDIYLRNDVIIPENSQNFRAYLNLRSFNGLNQENKSIFQLMNRDSILLSVDEDPIIPALVAQNN